MSCRDQDSAGRRYQVGVWHCGRPPAGFADRQTDTRGTHPASMVVTLTAKDRDPLTPRLDDGGIAAVTAPAPGRSRHASIAGA